MIIVIVPPTFVVVMGKLVVLLPAALSSVTLPVAMAPPLREAGLMVNEANWRRGVVRISEW
jgi:hypothetical protein